MSGNRSKPLRLAPSPPTLRPRKHRDLTQRPLLSSLSRALLRPVAIATGKAAVTEGVPTLYGAMLELAARAREDSAGDVLALWKRRGKRAFEQEVAPREEQD